MATLEWIRDHYDSNKNRYIEESELTTANDDWTAGTIDGSDFISILNAYNDHTLLPAYPTEPTAITCNASTPHFSSGCALLLNYDLDNSGIITDDGMNAAIADSVRGSITQDEKLFVYSAYLSGSINAACSGCYVETPPGMETRTTSLSEGSHTIQASLSGYDTLTATIYISSSGSVSCTSGPCGSSSPPSVTTSGSTATISLKRGTSTTGRCSWISTKDTSSVSYISEMVLAYNNLMTIGFTPTAGEIGDAVLMYVGLGTPSSLWGC